MLISIPLNKPTTEAELIAALATLQPLQKKHFSWPFPKEVVANANLLRQIIRINGAGSSWGDWDVAGHMDAQWAVMKELGVKEFALNHSPWAGAKVDDYGPDFQARIAKYTADLSSRAKTVADLNTKYGTDFYVASVNIDQETFHPTNSEDGAHIDVRNNISYRLVKQYFPKASIVQYGRGTYVWNDGPKKALQYYTTRELGAFFSCSLYNLTEIPGMRKIFMDTVAEAKDTFVIPFVALGGYIPRTLGNNNSGWQWKDYPLNFSWTMGAEINHQWYSDPVRSVMYAEWNRAPFVWFWPSCFDLNAKNYGLHYLAYVMGSQTIKEDWILG